MFKKLFLSFIFVVGVSGFLRSDDLLDVIGPTATTTGASSTISISNPGASLRNCLTDFSVTSSSNVTIRILDAGTTVYAVDISSTSAPIAGIQGLSPFNLQWPKDNAFCITYNSTMSFTVVNSTGSAAPAKVNYRGIIRGIR